MQLLVTRSIHLNFIASFAILLVGTTPVIQAQVGKGERPESAWICGFIPGDSFFSIYSLPNNIPLSEIDPYGTDFPEDKPKQLVFMYSAPRSPLPQGGPYPFKGVFYCRVNGYTERHSKLLQSIHTGASEEFETILKDAHLARENRGILMLIVNREFDFEQWHFYNRYNEKWETLGGYHPHLWMPEAVIDDWRNAERVAGLNAEVVGLNRERHLLWPYHKKDPELCLEVDMEKIVLVCIPTDDFSVAFRKNLNSTFYSMDSEKAYLHRWVTDRRTGDKRLVKTELDALD